MCETQVGPGSREAGQAPLGMSKGLSFSTQTSCHLSGIRRVLFCFFQALALFQEMVNAR